MPVCLDEQLSVVSPSSALSPAAWYYLRQFQTTVSLRRAFNTYHLDDFLSYHSDDLRPSFRLEQRFQPSNNDHFTHSITILQTHHGQYDEPSYRIIRTIFKAVSPPRFFRPYRFNDYDNSSERIISMILDTVSLG